MTRASTPDSVSFRRFLPFHLGGRQPRSKGTSLGSIGENMPTQPACVSKTKNHSKIHRWQVLCSFVGAEMCPDKKRPAENTCRIVKGLDAVWAHFCPSKPCLPLSIDGNILYECVNEIGRRGCGSTTPQPPAHSSESRGGTEIDYSAFSATAASFFLARAFSSQSLPSAKRETM